jgi:hypothetical protein
MGTTRLSLLSLAAVGAALVYAGCDFCNGYDTPCGCTSDGELTQQYNDHLTCGSDGQLHSSGGGYGGYNGYPSSSFTSDASPDADAAATPDGSSTDEDAAPPDAG